jgi:hypothetical protein
MPASVSMSIIGAMLGCCMGEGKDRASGGVRVDVRGRSGRSWAAAAAPERALDIFHHPFAYCADEPNLEDILLAA